ncbi:LCP family protein [Rhodococcus jostii]|uniref:LCP family protein n=1 Tax=Rhodococcus jostii TaxID=132919 RepID=UPI003638AA87
MIALLVLLVLVVVSGCLAVVCADRSLHRISALADYPGRIGATAGTNWLLVGSDGRGDLTADQQQQLDTGDDDRAGLSDTMMILHIPDGRIPPTLVSIPRDSYLPIPGHGTDKVNAAFAIGGAPLLVRTVEQATGLHLDHYAELGFGGFTQLVDVVGGVNMCLEHPINDADHGIVLPAGCHDLDGNQALGFVRERYELPGSDLDRMANQRQFMTTLMQKAVTAPNMLNPLRLWQLISATTDVIAVDDGDHVWDIATLGQALHRTDVVTTTVPVGGFEDTDTSGNVLLWDQSAATHLFDALAADTSSVRGAPTP